MDHPLKICIMIVDDNPADVRLMRDSLERAADVIPDLSAELGFDIRETDDLDDAILKLKSFGCDVVLLDLGLPPHEGTYAVKELRTAFPLLPLIVVSGNESDILALEAMRDGADDFVMKKELSPQRILRAVRYSIERAKKTSGILLYDTKNIDRLTELVKRLG